MADYLHGVEQYFLENMNRPIEVLAASVIGLVATADDAELFGSGVLGMDRDGYYEQIVGLTDSLWC